ncbi:CRISPR-associated CARF protein Csx1 [Caldisphaera sp.]|uniref:CRISPR-associated CARF protein Csx1 n=1 Tax=Caldisphaera sp. TaxID=2060322 RepID=UPI00397B0357
MGEKLLISAMGNFKNYKEVTYLVSEKPSEKSSKSNDKENQNSFKSYTSTKALCEAFNPDRVLVFIPFTLEMLKENSKYKDQAEKLKSNYKNDKVIEQLNECKDLTIEVAPVIGRFAMEDDKSVLFYEKKEGINLYPNYVYYKLINWLKESKDFDEVYVDLTHGINYMQVMVYNTVITAVNALVKPNTSGNGIKLRFFNSDPYQPRKNDTNAELHVNEVSRIIVRAKNGFNSLITQVLSVEENYYGKINGIEVEKLMRITRAAQAGQFLLLNYFKDFIEEKKKYLENKLSGIESMDVKVNKNVNNSIVTYDYDLHFSAYIMHALLESLSKVSKGNQEGLSEEELNNLADAYANDVSEVLIKNEVNRSRGKIKQCEDKPTPGTQVKLDLKSPYNTVPEKLTNKRDLIAHGGLEINVTCVKIEKDNRLIFSYLGGKDTAEKLLMNF